MDSMESFFSQLGNPKPKTPLASKPKPKTPSKRSRKRKDLDNDNDENENENDSNVNNFYQPPQKKKRKIDKTIATRKQNVAAAIKAKNVTFKDDNTIPNDLLKKHCKRPFDKEGNPMEHGDFTVCRMPVYDSNGNIAKYCDTIYKYIKNQGYAGILNHFKNKHSEAWNEWESQQPTKTTKNINIIHHH